MSIKSVVSTNYTRDLFGVLVRALISMVKVMSSDPDMSDNCIGKLQYCVLYNIL
jgi:hypothetical protein